MMDHRTYDRMHKRLRVQFETNDLKGIAITSDISPTGCQLHASAALKPGSRIRGMIVLADGSHVNFEADVRWSRHVTWALGQQMPNSVGVSFISPPGERFYQLLRGTAPAVH
jgi:hypothetical protein